MKAKLTIEINCEAGSKRCNVCKLQYFLGTGVGVCTAWREESSGGFKRLDGDANGLFRCRQCLDSEICQKDFVSKKKIEKIIHHEDMGSWRGTRLVKKLERIVGKK